MIHVSIVIPAYNAAKTLEETIASLFAQTYSAWEGIIIDDGSEDETAAIAKRFAEQDSRIRVVSQPNSGVCAARNLGISLAQYNWLLFLDADDWIAPEYLERMTGLLSSDSSLDAVHCGWSRVASDGTFGNEYYAPSQTDLFPTLAGYPALTMHACIVRKELVKTVGEFDPSVQVYEDWDLWQRIARTGACFGAVKETLAFDRIGPNSVLSGNSQSLLDTMQILIQGHSSDLRVSNPHPNYAQGQPVQELTGAKLLWISWLVGLLLGREEDIQPLLELIPNEPEPALDPYSVAKNIFESTLFPAGQPLTAWIERWSVVEPHIHRFLSELEVKSQAFGLAHRARIILERLILQHIETTFLPITIGSTHAIKVEVSEEVGDIHLSETVDRLYCLVELEGTSLGTLELPVCDGLVSRYVLLDAIVANFDFAWKILGRFFEHTVYCKTINQQATDSIENLHNQVGWETFLRELWGRPDWSNEQFYDSSLVESNVAPQIHAATGWLKIEISQEIPDVSVTASELNVVFTVAGDALGVVTLPVKQNLVSAQMLRVAITTEGGMELCRVCVREGLIGRSLTDPTSLRMRLAETTQSKQNDESASVFAKLSTLNAEILTCPDSHALANFQTALFLGRRTEAMGTSASRRASLPQAAINELLDASNSMNEPSIAVVQQEQSFEKSFERAVYVPELVMCSSLAQSSSHPSSVQSSSVQPFLNPSSQSVNTSQVRQVAFSSRNHFETLFATQPDPWKYTTPYEQVKYEQTLALLPSNRIERALELACAEGHFTVQLAPQVGSLIATDISQIALDRAAQRCANLPNVSFMHLDLSRDPLPGLFDLIVCSEVLYYIGDRKALQSFAQRVAEALQPGGYFLTAHANLVVDEPDRPGFNWNHPFGAKGIGDTFASIDSLQLVKELRTPLYRIQLFQRCDRSWFSSQLWFSHKKQAEIVELPQPTPPPERVAETVLWNGGQPQSDKVSQPVTKRLPILMYHRVAPTSSPQLKRWCVTPEAFEAQLSYLRDAGYYSITLETWRKAMLTRSPLPGRAILLTFDDGYLDFFTYAYPLLQQYGFSAIVFLVAEQVGKSNSWDTVYGEELPLMNWQQIRQLQANGIEFGAHSATHRPLTALSVTEIVQEGARSRAILQRELGVPVRSFAYPYGDFDAVVEHLIGACGYTFSVSCRYGFSQFQDSLLALPRIEVTGQDTLQHFVAKLSL